MLIKELKNMPKSWRGRTMAQIVPDESLAKIVGTNPLLSYELIKNLWVYIRKNCEVKKVKID